MARGYLVVAAEEKVLQHPEKVKVNKARRLAEQEGIVHQHFLERQQAVFEFFQPTAPLRAPLLDAAAAKFALFETQILQLVARRHVFLVINIIQPEGRPFDLVFNKAPKNALDAFQFGREQAQAKFGVEILSDDLRIFADFENVSLPSIRIGTP